MKYFSEALLGNWNCELGILGLAWVVLIMVNGWTTRMIMMIRKNDILSNVFLKSCRQLQGCDILEGRNEQTLTTHDKHGKVHSR